MLPWILGVWVVAMLIPVVDVDVDAGDWGAWCVFITLVLAFGFGMAAVVA